MRRIQKQAAGGFTLIELLVVVTIIGILIAMLLPAVNQVRESARRAECSNNMRQLAIALNTYRVTHKSYPPGWLLGDTNNKGAMETFPQFGWGALILAEIEQQPLLDRMGGGKKPLKDVIQNTATRDLPQTIIPVFRCPTDDHDDLLTGRRHFNSKANGDSWRPATANYIANSGMFDTGWDFPHNGIMHGNSKISDRHIKDGESNTFLLGERDSRCQAGAWCGARNPPGPDMWGSYFVRGRVSWPLNGEETGHSSATCAEGFSSPHVGGAFFAFCDARVIFIDENISYELGGLTTGDLGNKSKVNAYDGNKLGTYQRFAIRDDNMPIDYQP